MALYEQQRAHHVGSPLSGLEDQMCGWCPTEPGPSPDRVDALVWTVTELMLAAQVKPARFAHVDWMQR